MRRYIFILLSVTLSVYTFSAEKTIGGITYTYTSGTPTAKVKTGSTDANVVIPQTIQIDDNSYTIIELSQDCFKNKTTLQTISIPSSVTTIGKTAFMGCTSLQAFDFTYITSIGDQAFQGCTSLTEVYLLQGTLGRSVFYNCSNIVKATIGSGVTSVDDTFFYGCSNLTEAALLGGNIGRNKVFSRVSSLKTLTIGNITTTHDYMYDLFDGKSYCKVETITLLGSAIPAHFIEDFSELKTVILSENTTSIGDDAFLNCKKVESVTCLSAVPPIVEKADYKSGMAVHGSLNFTKDEKGGNRSNVSLTVPYDYMNVYAATDVWKDFSPLRGTGTGNLYDGKESPTVYDETVQNGRLSTWKTMATPMNVCLHREFEGDGGYYTICLPFSLTAEQLAASPFAGDELLTLTEVKDYSGTLCFLLENVSEIEAGKPYLIKIAEGETRTAPLFENVTITLDATADDEARTTAAADADFVGILKPTHIDDEDHKVLFLSSGTTLTWATDGGDADAKMGGFRAYFRITSAAVPQGMPARIMMRDEAPAGLQSVSGDGQTPARKYINGGRMVIEREGRRYDITGREL